MVRANMGEESVDFTLTKEAGDFNMTGIMENETSGARADSQSPCPDPDSYPTIAEFNEVLGTWASVLYVVSAVIVVILALQYGFLVGKFNKNVPNQRKVREIYIFGGSRSPKNNVRTAGAKINPFRWRRCGSTPSTLWWPCSRC